MSTADSAEIDFKHKKYEWKEKRVFNTKNS